MRLNQSRGNSRRVCARINHTETPVGYVPGLVMRKLLPGMRRNQSRGSSRRVCARISRTETPVRYVPRLVTWKLLSGMRPKQSRGNSRRVCSRINHVETCRVCARINHAETPVGYDSKIILKFFARKTRALLAIHNALSLLASTYIDTVGKIKTFAM